MNTMTRDTDRQEQERLSELQRYRIMDTERESDFDDLSRLAAQLCGVSLAAITFIDRDRQWFKSALGFDAWQAPRNHSFCMHAMEQTAPLVVTDAWRDPRFADAPFVTGAPHMRFYAGVPLITPDGYAIGTFCVMDPSPSEISDGQLDMLKALANQISKLLELRRQKFELEQTLRERERSALEFRRFEARLADAQRAAHIGNWELQLDQKSVYWSDEVYRIFGVDAAAFAHTFDAFAALVHPDDRPALALAQGKATRGEAPLDIEYRIVRPDGAIRYVQAYAKAFGGDGERGERLSGTVQDVTEKKCIEAELALVRARERAATKAAEQARHHFQSLFESAPGLYLVLTPDDFCIVAASNAYLDATRATRTAAIGGLLFDVFPEVRNDTDPNGRSNLQASLERVRKTGTTDVMAIQCFPVPRPGAHGGTLEDRYWSAVNSPVIDASGRVLFIIHRIEDVTDSILNQDVVADGRSDGGRLQQTEQMGAAILLRSLELQRVTERLRNSEEKFRSAFENLIVGFALADLNGMFREVNQKFCDMLGYSEAELQQKTLFMLTHPEDRPANDALIEQVCSARINHYQIEKRYLHKDGHAVWVRNYVSLICDNLGKPLHTVAIVNDLTEEKAVQEQLRKTDALLRIAGRLARIGGWFVDLETRRMTWTDEVYAIHEMHAGKEAPSFEEAVALYAPEWRAAIRAAFEACVERGAPFDMEAEILTAAGRRVWARIIGAAERDAGGVIRRISGAFLDISKRRQDQYEIEQIAARLTNTLESITDAFFTLDNDWRFTYVNSEAERLMRRGRAELLGNDIWEIFPEAVGSRFHIDYRRAVEQQTTASLEEFYPPLGMWLEIHAYPSAEGLAVHFRDISERKAIEQRLQLLEASIERINDIVMITDTDLDRDGPHIVYVNDAFVRLTGYGREEAIGNTPAMLHGPATDRAAIGHIRDCLRHRRPVRAELINYTKSGAPFWLEVDIAPVADDADRFAHWVAIERDITDRKKTEATQLETKQRFESLATSANDALWDWNLIDGSMWWGDGIERLFGFSRNELEPQIDSLRRNIHPDDLQRVISSTEKFIVNGDARWHLEFRFRRRDGSYAFVIERGAIIRDPAGAAIRLVGGLSDVSEQRQYLQQLKEQAELLDKAKDAILVRDLDHCVRFWNKAAERVYGWTREEALGSSVEALLYPASSGAFIEATQETLRKGEWSGRIQQTRNDGRIITVEGHWTLVRDDEGRPSAIFAINTDISERIDLEHRLAQSQKLEAIGQLTGGIAHDFNNLLTVIIGNAEILNEELQDGSNLSSLAQMVLTAGRRGAELTNRLLAFARKQALEPKVINAGETIEGMNALLQRTLGTDIEVQIMRDEKLWLISIDPVQLESAILNLCINARDAMPQGGHLLLEASNIALEDKYVEQHVDMPAGHYVLIAVTDTGTGMAPGVLERAFEPFFTTWSMGSPGSPADIRESIPSRNTVRSSSCTCRPSSTRAANRFRTTPGWAVRKAPKASCWSKTTIWCACMPRRCCAASAMR
jgi:PAS domain S-box-containing protein